MYAHTVAHHQTAALICIAAVGPHDVCIHQFYNTLTSVDESSFNEYVKKRLLLELDQRVPAVAASRQIDR